MMNTIKRLKKKVIPLMVKVMRAHCILIGLQSIETKKSQILHKINRELKFSPLSKTKTVGKSPVSSDDSSKVNNPV
jgi:hypothetical protein